MNYVREKYFKLIGEVMGLKCFTCWNSCNLTDNVHLYGVISNKYEYLKPRCTTSMEYDVDTEPDILRISLDKFFKRNYYNAVSRIRIKS